MQWAACNDSSGQHSSHVVTEASGYNGLINKVRDGLIGKNLSSQMSPVTIWATTMDLYLTDSSERIVSSKSVLSNVILNESLAL